MDLRQIQYFLTLYEEESVTRAARKLNIVQPALSMQIAKLEKDLGRQLFTRTARRMIPTPAAEQMNKLFRPLMQDFAMAREQVMHSGDSLSGHLRIGIIPTIGYHILPEVLERFSARYPQVTLSVAEGMTDDLVERVARGQLDICYTNIPSRSHPVGTLPVLTERLMFVTAQDGVLLRATTNQSEINAQKFVFPTRDNGLRRILEDALRQTKLTIVPALELDSTLSMTQLVENGHYACFLPETLLHGLTQKFGFKLRSQALNNPGFQRQLTASYNNHRGLSSLTKAFHQVMSGQMFALQVRKEPTKSDQEQETGVES